MIETIYMLPGADEYHRSIYFLLFSVSCLPQNMMLEFIHFSSTPGSLYDGVNEIIVGALLKCFAPLSVDYVLTPIL